jgi:nucleoside-diphosphate kinase
MTTRVHESCVLEFPIEEVWNVLRPLNFSFVTGVASSEVDASHAADEVGSFRKIVYTDKTTQKVKLVELSDAQNTLTYELVESSPAITYSGVIHTWRLRRITHDKTTLFEFVSDYSIDASTGVTQDSKFKKLEFFKDVRAALGRGAGKAEQKGGEKKADFVPQSGVAGSKTERTFIAVKPDGVQRGLVGDIIGRFEKRGYKLVALKMLWPTREKAEGHYEEHRGKPFFNKLTSFFASGPIVGMVWEGSNVIAVGRAMLGATKPENSAPGTIRGDLAVDMGRNVCHGSDGPAGAAREIAYWFKPEEVCSWTPTNVQWVYE